jgi:hypothetical protein
MAPGDSYLHDTPAAPRSVAELVTAERARLRRAVRELRAAIVLTFVTLALIVASVGVGWYA